MLSERFSQFTSERKKLTRHDSQVMEAVVRESPKK